MSNIKYLNNTEASTPESTLTEWVVSGQIPTISISGANLIDRDDLDKHLKSCKSSVKSPNPSISPIGLGQLGVTIESISSWKGNRLTVAIRAKRGYEFCQIEGCNTRFSQVNMLTCPQHKTMPFKVYIDITGKGLRKFDLTRVRIAEMNDGTPLQLLSAIYLKQQIQEQIQNHTFTPNKYLHGGKELRFGIYKKKYLKRMKQRADRPQDADDWMSQSALIDIEKYHRNYLHYFDNIFIHDITTHTIDNFLDGLIGLNGKLASSYTKYKIVAHMRHLLRWAVSKTDLRKAPEMPTTSRKPKPHTVLTREQQLELINHLPAKHRPIFRWAMETGRRINEYRAIRARDLNFPKEEYYSCGSFDNEIYKPFPKIKENEKTAYPLLPELKTILSEVLADRVYGPDSYIFLNPNSGKPYTQAALDSVFRKALKKTGYKVTPNEFGRHSLAVHMISNEASYTEVSIILGNSAEIVERNYAPSNVAQKAKIMKKRIG